jgi:hypothetical protein
MFLVDVLELGLKGSMLGSPGSSFTQKGFDHQVHAEVKATKNCNLCFEKGN